MFVQWSGDKNFNVLGLGESLHVIMNRLLNGLLFLYSSLSYAMVTTNHELSSKL